jgi:large subunit ribosomal protein L25
MSQDVTLRAEPRSVVGKKVKALRREGLIPGVVYGPVVDGTIQVSVEQKEFLRIYKAIGLNSLMTLEWDGGSQPVFIREVQVDPVRWNPLHIDFFAPNLRVEITAPVPVTHGEASGDLVGIINQVISEVQVRGLPANLPNHLTVDISALTEPGQHVVAGDIELPEGIALLTPAEDVLITVLAPTVEEVEEAPETAEEAEAAEEAAESVPATEASGGDDSGASES